jgi:hypothetical protein
MNFSSNIKDTLSTIAAILGIISGLVLALPTQGVVLPSLITTIAVIAASISVGIIGVLTGKLPNGGTKPVEVVTAANQEAASVTALKVQKAAEVSVAATNMGPK